MTAFDYFKECVTKKYANFKGRARRSEYWNFILLSNFFVLDCALIDYLVGWELPILAIISSLVFIIPSIAVTIRRLHDTSRRGSWILVSLIPFVGPLVLLILMCLDSTPGTNIWGNYPKGVGEGERLTIFDYFTESITKKYTNFKDRSRRIEYWSFVVVSTLAILYAALIDYLTFVTWGFPIFLTIIFGIALLIPNLAITIRRLHDTSRSGWWILIRLVPFCGGLIFLVLMFLDSTPGTNAWGENPKGIGSREPIDSLMLSGA